MNFYKRFIGDITAKTGGLSLARMGAYDRLLDHYYSTELPIPPEEIYSVCRAMSKADRADVDVVLARFWDLTAEGFVQRKADEVIAKARPLIDAARENGKKGGRPPKQNPAGYEEKPSGFQKQNPAKTQMVKPSQSQSQISPSLRSGDASALALGVTPQKLADWQVIRKAKKLGALTETAVDMHRREAGKAGITPAEAVDFCCLYGWGGFNAKWFIERQAQSPGNAKPPTAREQRMQEALRPLAGLSGGMTPEDFIDTETRDVTLAIDH